MTTATATVTATAFDAYVETYEEACAQGLRLAGEERDYFARLRVQHTARRCPDAARVRSVVDFGCGLGHSVPHLADEFPGASIVGLDEAAKAIDAARQRYGSDKASFFTTAAAPADLGAELVYCNGVFHHVDLAARVAVAEQVRRLLLPGGIFALWENNPWNPGTRLVMSRIPFDRDAVPLSCWEAQTLLRRAGFRVLDTRYYFWFPAPLRMLRGLEPYLEHMPFGAQYCVWGQKPCR